MEALKTYHLDGEDLQNIVRDLESQPRPRYTMQMAASDYPFLSDEEFTAMCNTSNIHFLGGLEGVNKMRERMKRLNISLNH